MGKLLSGPTTVDSDRVSSCVGRRGVTYPSYNSRSFASVHGFGLVFGAFRNIARSDASALCLHPRATRNVFMGFGGVTEADHGGMPFNIKRVNGSFHGRVAPNGFVFHAHRFRRVRLRFFYGPNASLR